MTTTSDADLIRLIAHIIPWPDDHLERPSLELRWTITWNEETIVEASKRPFEDATALLVRAGVDPERLVTMRHSHLPYDSFTPHSLGVAAKKGLKRMEAGDKFRAYLAAKGEDEPEHAPDVG